ncbi:TetR/AcrR family transcriptional regulator [Gordonia aurantiaca]|uniref:TetR/AcrR family transcriptional regulator n=1 Tax=Gordonia sp. B21 TaxID=3151852 RepID=UPI0032651EF9
MSDATPRSRPRYLDLLWDREDPTPRRGPRPTLTIRDIGAQAVEIADTHGVDAVSMKAVATGLGLTTMSLYRYVDSKDELIEVMIDTGFGRFDATLTGTWRERLTSWAHRAAQVARNRPWLATIPLRRPPVGPNILSWSEAGVGCFDGTPLTEQQKLSALLLVDGFVRHHVRQSSQMGLIGNPGTADSGDTGATYEELVAEYTSGGGYPHLFAAFTDPSVADSVDDDFFGDELDFGLRVIFDGLERLIDEM